MKNNQSINIILLQKRDEKYIFLYDDNFSNYAETLRALGRYAGNDDLSLNWYDAAVISHRMRKMKEEKRNSTANVLYRMPHWG